jgi:hypothetical protein
VPIGDCRLAPGRAQPPPMLPEGQPPDPLPARHCLARCRLVVNRGEARQRALRGCPHNTARVLKVHAVCPHKQTNFVEDNKFLNPLNGAYTCAPLCGPLNGVHTPLWGRACRQNPHLRSSHRASTPLIPPHHYVPSLQTQSQYYFALKKS